MSQAFSRKAKKQTGGVDSEARKEWNKYVASCFNAKENDRGDGKTRKQKTLIGIVNFVFDMGLPPADKGRYDTKCALPKEGEKYSQEEEAYKEKYPKADFIWDEVWDKKKEAYVRKRLQTSPQFSQQEYGICVDFPSWLVDYSKHPNSTETEPQIRPYRISLNGVNNLGNVDRHIKFQTNRAGTISDNNIVYKICAAAGREQELIESDFDIGTIAEAVCNFKVTCDTQEKEDNFYLNTSATTPSTIEDIEMPDDSIYTAEQQIKKALDVEGLAPFVGILLDMEEYTDEMLSMVGFDHFRFVKRASESKVEVIEGTRKDGTEYSFEKGIMIEDKDGNLKAVGFNDTPFAKAYREWLSKQEGAKAPNGKTDTKTQIDSSLEEDNTQSTTKTTTEDDSHFDFDDDIPF